MKYDTFWKKIMRPKWAKSHIVPHLPIQLKSICFYISSTYNSTSFNSSFPPNFVVVKIKISQWKTFKNCDILNQNQTLLWNYKIKNVDGHLIFSFPVWRRIDDANVVNQKFSKIHELFCSRPPVWNIRNFHNQIY